MARWRYSFRKLGPRWLVKDGEAEQVFYSHGVILDAAMDRLELGAKARFPSLAPEDALGPLGRDRRIVRGINESADSYAARLVRWLDDWRRAGNPFALMAQLRGYLNAAVRLRTVDRRGNWFSLLEDGTQEALLNQANWDWDDAPASPRWARFWVIIYPLSTGLWTDEGRWGGGGVWGEDGSFGTTATLDQVASVRAIVRDWKPQGTKCEYIIVALESTSFDPTAPEPDGTWEHHGVNNGGDYEPARLATARYWPGRQAA